MKRLIQFEYSIGDRVVVKDLGDIGMVYALSVSRDGVEYRVKWFTDGDRKDEWFRGEELGEA